MPQLKAVLPSLDGVEEALKGFYVKADDGRFFLGVEGVDDMPAVAGLKKKNNELLGEKKELQTKHDELKKVFSDAGLEPDQIGDLKKRAESGGGKDITKLREDYDAKLKSTSEQAQREVQAAKKEAANATRAAEDYFLGSEIGRALGAAKGEPELLDPVMRKSLKVERTGDGKFRAVVIDAQGNQRIRDSQGNPLTLDDLAGELKANPKYGRAFEPSGQSGSGAPQGGGPAGSGSTTTFDRNDPMAWGQNADKMAKGEAQAV